MLYKLFCTYECNYVLYIDISFFIYSNSNHSHIYSRYPFINVKRNYILHFILIFNVSKLFSWKLSHRNYQSILLLIWHKFRCLTRSKLSGQSRLQFL